MERLFQTHQIRQTIDLEGMWEFAKLEAQSETDLSAVRYMYQLPVPGCWENHPQLLTYRGRGIYRRAVKLQHSQPIRLVFKGVSHTARVYWDGIMVGEHYNAYTAFSVVIPEGHAGEHELAVEVDNSFGVHSALHLPNDYYTYGGMIRPVMMELLPADSCWIEQVHMIPFKSSWELEHEGQWQAKIRVRLRSLSTKPISGCLQLQFTDIKGQLTDHLAESDHRMEVIGIEDTHTGEMESSYIMDGIILTAAMTIQPGEIREWETTCLLKGIHAWSPDYPCLYELHIRWHPCNEEYNNLLEIQADRKQANNTENTAAPMSAAADDLIERVGFRMIASESGHILLNNERVVLQGFNRHEDHPLVGAAFPLALMVHDMELMAEAGANAVRTSHYPNDERFLDLCDQYGMLVWEENHARGLGIEDMRHPLFVTQCEQVNREMVEQHYNHPSIIIWAILNECASDLEEGRVHYERQLQQIRSLDQSRLLSFASHHREQERCFDLTDVVSFNLYPGWYGDEDPGELCDRARGWADTLGGAGKPMIMSEFGADGFYGYRSPSRVKGTEERQLDIVESNLRAYTDREYLSGMFIWQFCDCRVTEEGIWPMLRARTQNNKGIVDAYRRPKLAYEMVKSYFNNKLVR